MKILSTQVTKVTFSGVKNLDPVSAIFEDYGPGQGRVTIVCCDQSWTKAWMSFTPTLTTKEFFCDSPTSYLVDKLSQMIGDSADSYLTRIITTVKAGLEAMKALEIAANPLPDDAPPTLHTSTLPRRSSTIEADEI